MSAQFFKDRESNKVNYKCNRISSFAAALVLLLLFSSIIPNLVTSENPRYILNQESVLKTLAVKDHQPAMDEQLINSIELDDDLGLFIIKLDNPIKQDSMVQLKKTGGVLINYFGDNKFLIYSTKNDLDKLIDENIIVNAQKYNSTMKYNPEIINKLILDNINVDDLLRLMLQIYPGTSPGVNRNIIIDQVEQFGGQVLSTSFDRMEIEINAKYIDHLADLNIVLWLEPVPEFRYLNDVAADIIDSVDIWNDLGLDGTGQVVTVCDTGLDNGSYSNLHKDFQGRLLHAYTLGRNGDWSDDDISLMGQPVGGHGTHVAGSVLGGGNWSNGQFKGMAYNASLVFQSTMTSNGNMNIPNDLYYGLFFPPYNSYNSRIHTNSWGDFQSAGEYSTWSNVTDKFIYENPDMVILFAAGNIVMGITDTSVPGTAKNIITVGASESYRPGISFPGYPNSCDNTDQRASFSCYGTDDKRLKPDVLAPGSGILSTRSSLIANPDNNYWLGYDAFYAYAGGTSMATPVTAGAVTLIRQYFTDIEKLEPSAALVKAALINGAEDLPVSGGTAPIPNYQEGWGRINLSKSINQKQPSNLIFIDNQTGVAAFKNYTYTIEVVNDTVPLNITLVWTDYPGSPASSIALVNDLNLNFTHEQSGVSYKGNVFNNGWSSSDDSYANKDWDKYGTRYDNINNVEGLRIKNPKLGRYKLTIIGNSVPFGPQPFAVAISGGLNKDLLIPTNLKVEPDPNGNALNISWDRIYRPDIVGYQIFRSNFSDTGFIIINQTNGPGVKKFHDTGLKNGQYYYYKIRTMNTMGKFSNFSSVVWGIPQDIIAPYLFIKKPKNYDRLNKIVEIFYENGTDCEKIIFTYYNDTNSNGIIDDGNTWNMIGVDEELTGRFFWDTTDPKIGPLNQNSVILRAEANDEALNIRTKLITHIEIDNKEPTAPILYQYLNNPTNKTTAYIEGTSPIMYGEVRVYSNGVLIGNTSSFSMSLTFLINVELFDGLNTITARALDDLGNGPGPVSNAIEIMVDIVPPTADAGGNQYVDEDNWFQFNASSSYDTNPRPEYNKIISYIWYFKNLNGTEVRLEGMTPIHFFDTMGNYTIYLRVQDMAGNWGEQQFWVLVRDKTKPIANAGDGFTWDEDKMLNLNGNLSTDNDPSLIFTGNFSWSFYDYDITDLRKGKIKKVDMDGINISYTFLVPDVYQITLNVTDIGGNWGVDSILVTIRDITPPTANAGSDKRILKGRSVVFDGTNSTDNDPKFLETANFTWEFNNVGEYVFLYGIRTGFRFKKDYVFNIRFTVTDKWGNEDSDELIIFVDSDLNFPYVLWTYPNDFSSGIPVTSIIKLKLNETLDTDLVPINDTSFQVFDSRDNELRGRISYDPIESLILFIPNSVLRYSESYTVYLRNIVVDLAGNKLDGNRNGLIEPESIDNFKLVFRTINMTLHPRANKEDVPLDTKITINFDYPIPNQTLKNLKINLTDKLTGQMISGKVNIDLESNEIIFSPDNELDRDKFYQVTVVVLFYLLPDENVTLTTQDRIVIIEQLDQDIINNTNINKTESYYMWSFRTSKIGVDVDGILNIDINYLLIFLAPCIIFIILIIILVMVVISRKRLEEKERLAIAVKENEEEELHEDYIDADAEDEFEIDYFDEEVDEELDEEVDDEGDVEEEEDEEDEEEEDVEEEELEEFDEFEDIDEYEISWEE